MGVVWFVQCIVIEDNMFSMGKRTMIERTKIMQPSYCVMDENGSVLSEDPEMVALGDARDC